MIFIYRTFPALLIGLTLLLTAGCASTPKPELDAARAAVAKAYAAGAPEYASEEYQAARAALDNAEQLTKEGKHSAARDILPFAEAQARQAATKARENRAEAEAARLKNLQKEKRQKQLAEAEARRKKEQAARKKVAAKKKPAPPRQVDLYSVKPEENLLQIAARPEVYNDQTLWPLLYKANRDQITDPRKIYPGQDLTVPRNSSQDELNEARKEAAESGIFPLIPAVAAPD